MKFNTELKVDSIMFNGRESADLQAQTGRYGDPEDAEISIWTNGGSAYRFNATPEEAQKIDSLSNQERDRLASYIAKKVAETVEIEMNRLLNSLDK